MKTLYQINEEFAAIQKKFEEKAKADETIINGLNETIDEYRGRIEALETALGRGETDVTFVEPTSGGEKTEGA